MLDAILRFENLMTAAVTIAVFVYCVLLHYEASIRFNRHIEMSKRSLRWRFLVLMSGISLPMLRKSGSFPVAPPFS